MDIVKVKSAILIFVFISAGFVFGGKALACGGPPPEGCPSACDTWDPVKEKCIEGCKCACMGCEESTGYCYEDCDWEHGEHCCCPPDGGSGGGCCEADECCVDGACVGPICENCHSVSATLWECHHSPSDPNGASCSTEACIKNVLSSASCNHKGPDWPCSVSRCNTTTVSPETFEVWQRKYWASCSGGTVSWGIWMKLWAGCYTCGWHGYNVACTVGGCDESDPAGPGQPVGLKRQCGGCQY